MLLHVGLAADEPDLLATPDRDADRAARMRADRFQDAHRFDRGDGAVGVVGGTGCRGQRIEMRADEHDFVAQHRILAGDLGDHVVAVEVALLVRRAEFEAQLRRHARLHHPHDHVVVLGHDDDGRHRVRRGSDGLPPTVTVPCSSDAGRRMAPAPSFCSSAFIALAGMTDVRLPFGRRLGTADAHQPIGVGRLLADR